MPTQTGSLDLKGLKQTYNKTIAVVQPIYCRTNSSTAPAASTRPTTVKITKTNDTGTTAPSSNGNGWTTMLMARICSSNVSYKYLWTCQQLLAADGTVLGCTSIVEDKGTTIIDGDTVTTGTVSAARLNIAGVITAINDNTTTTINGGKITTGTLSANSIDASSGTFATALIPQLTISKIDTLQTTLDGKAALGAENTALSYLSYDTTNGLKIAQSSPSGATTNYIQITSTNINIVKSSTYKATIDATNGLLIYAGDASNAVAQFGSTVRVGKEANGYARTLINTGGMQVVQKSSTGTDIVLANIGYGDGADSSGGTTKAPYYTLGTRGGSTVGNYSVAEGNNTTASGFCSHAEGRDTIASGNFSRASGYGAEASGLLSRAEGLDVVASGSNSHADGVSTQAVGAASHAEGSATTASGSASHAEGKSTTASGDWSHAGGYSTIAQGDSQTAIGKYNVADSTSLFIIGNGTSSTRSNALTVNWDGSVDIASGAKYKINGTALSASDVGAVPTSRTVNSKALSSNITLSAADVSAVALSDKYIRSSSGGLDWSTQADGEAKVLTKSALAYWNGTYNGTNSNLTKSAAGTIIGRNQICYANSRVDTFSSGQITIANSSLGVTTGAKPVGIILTPEYGTAVIMKYNYDSSTATNSIIQCWNHDGTAYSGAMRYFAVVFQNTWTTT